MIGLFTVTSVVDAPETCHAKSAVVGGVEGTFYIPFEYRPAISTLRVGDDFFGVLDEASGFGAILYKVSDGVADDRTFRISGDLSASGSVTVASDLTVGGTVSGSSPSASLVLTPAHTAAIVASATSGAPVTLEGVVISLR